MHVMIRVGSRFEIIGYDGRVVFKTRKHEGILIPKRALMP